MPHSFTPGPWETLKFSQHELQTDFAMVKIGERVHMIGYSDEDKANARLIAAAPDLLEALQEFVRTMDSLPESDETSLRVWDMYQMAQAAIKKAGGDA